ncbi:uncharacterized protein TNCV_653931 [Trichonephila clavipes]|nr:uncharacterized protein TNCV_653931 [Trichonephila clavipes]
MDFTEINSRGKREELLGRIDRQNSRFRTTRTIIVKFVLHASFVELESAKNALNEASAQLLSLYLHTSLKSLLEEKMNYLFALLIVLVGTQTVDITAITGTEQSKVKWTGRNRRILKWICFNFLLFDSDYILYLQENFFNASLLSVVISQVF